MLCLLFLSVPWFPKVTRAWVVRLRLPEMQSPGWWVVDVIAFRVALASLLASILAALLATSAAPEWLEKQARKERLQAADWIGEQRASALYRTAQDLIIPLFPETAAASDEPEGVRDVVPVPWESGQARQVFVQSGFRLLVTGYLFLVFFPITVAAVIDGIAIRRKKTEMHRPENPRVYHFAKKTLVAIIALPPVIATVPFAIAPVIGVVWCALATLTAWGMAQNVERQI